MTKVIVEVCVSSTAEAIAAEEAGADRIELCGALELGGLTPSLGLVETCLEAVSIPIVAMIRPRAGGFFYDSQELRAMHRDVDRLLAAGVQGIVFAVLDGEGQIDRHRNAALIGAATGRTTVFHRAFDFLADTDVALEQLIDLGFGRLLTSGGAPRAIEGAPQLSRLIRAAAGRLEIMPGGGIRADHLLPLLQQTGCSSVHVGPSIAVTDGSIDSSSQLNLCDQRCSQGNRFRRLDGEAVGAVVRAAAEGLGRKEL